MKLAYENEECPEACSLVHDVPPRGTMTCPDTGTLFMFCDHCDNWFDPEDNPQNTSLIERGNRITLCDPSAHDHVRCGQCETWIRAVDASEPCYNTTQFCESCWTSMGGCDCGECRADRGDPYGEDECEAGETVTICTGCGTGDLYLDLLSEEFFCKCSMDAMLAVQPDRPFKIPVAA